MSYSRAKTLRQLVEDLKKLVEKNPDIADAMVVTEHSASGAVDHINSFFVTVLSEYDVERSEYGFFYEDEGLKPGDRVVTLSVGGN
jgi:hypothetical protein